MPEAIEVRLGAQAVKEFMEGFAGRGDIRSEDLAIIETMSVSIVCEPGTFNIEGRSPNVQLVKPDLVKGTAFHQADFAKWVWVVTPCMRGKHTLFVKVSAAIKDSRGLPSTSSLPDKVISVTVRVHLLRAAIGAMSYGARAVLSAGITALVGAITKDYWWPYLRDVVLPAIREMSGMR